MAHAWDVIAYTYDADTHCPGCARQRFGSEEHGWVPEGVTDSEGNEPGAVFADSEWCDIDTDEPQVLVCGTCGGVIDEYDPR